MSKLCKVFISVILTLVVFAGVYVGVMTKGFKKWDKLSFKEEKEKVDNTIFPEKLRTEKAYVGYCVVVTGEGSSSWTYPLPKVYSRKACAKDLKYIFDLSKKEMVARLDCFAEYYTYDIDGNLLNSFTIIDFDKQIDGSLVATYNVSMDVSEELNEYKDVIEEGLDLSPYFSYWIEVKVLKNFENNDLYDVSVIWHVFSVSNNV